MQDKIRHLIYLVSENDDQLAFDELYRYYFPGLLSFANSIVKDYQFSEEIILDVFYKVWENRKMLPTIKNVSSYLYVATKHAGISFLRKKRILFVDEIEDDFLYSYNAADTALLSKENLTEINAAINSLPPKCRLIFRLIKEENLKYEEVSHLLNISVKTVDAQLCIANKRIIDIFQKILPDFHIKIANKK